MSYKRMIIMGALVFGLVITSISIYIGFEYLVGHNKYLGLIIGTILMLIGLIVYLVGRKKTICHIISFVINMMGVGLSITSYYIFKEFPLGFNDFIFAMGVSLAVLLGFGLLISIRFVRKHPKIFISLVISVSFITSLILWMNVKEFTGLSFYFLNISYFFMIGMIASSDSFNDLSKELALVSFGAFMLISLIVLIILTEGEALTGLDFAGSGPSGKPNRKKEMM